MLKRIIFIGLIIFLSFSPFFSRAINFVAIKPGSIPGAKDFGVEESPIKEPEGLLEVVADIVGWVYTIFFVVAVLFILIAAFNYLTGGSQPEKIKLAHSQLMYAAIAIAIALLSVGIVAIIENFLGGSSTPPPSPPPTRV